MSFDYLSNNEAYALHLADQLIYLKSNKQSFLIRRRKAKNNWASVRDNVIVSYIGSAHCFGAEIPSDFRFAATEISKFSPETAYMLTESLFFAFAFELTDDQKILMRQVKAYNVLGKTAMKFWAPGKSISEIATMGLGEITGSLTSGLDGLVATSTADPAGTGAMATATNIAGHVDQADKIRQTATSLARGNNRTVLDIDTAKTAKDQLANKEEYFAIRRQTVVLRNRFGVKATDYSIIDAGPTSFNIARRVSDATEPLTNREVYIMNPFSSNPGYVIGLKHQRGDLSRTPDLHTYYVGNRFVNTGKYITYQETKKTGESRNFLFSESGPPSGTIGTRDVSTDVKTSFEAISSRDQRSNRRRRRSTSNSSVGSHDGRPMMRPR